jgi:drug/metabolite transporter (DMT)-like permease
MQSPKHARACVWLLIATAFWGISFPLIKSIWLVQQQLVPGISSFCFASSLAVLRFATAGAVMALFSMASLRRITRLEWEEGLGLGVFGGLGILFQMDGLAHTSASVSAFLTQFYCLLIPIWVAWCCRALPKIAVAISSVMVLAGVAILAEFNWREFKMGRGEAETLLAAIFFAGQILWLERPRYAANRVGNFTVIMFGTIALLFTPLMFLTAPSPSALVTAYSSVPVLVMVAAIVTVCTLGAYTLMNVWQPHVTATEAGLIYCVEPVCAAFFAAVLPAMISDWSGISYANERLTGNILIGGALITAANVLIQIEAMLTRRKRERSLP